MSAKDLSAVQAKINSCVRTLEQFMADKDEALGKEGIKIVRDILRGIRQAADEKIKDKINSYVDHLEFIMADKDMVLGKKEIEIVGDVIHVIRQAAEELKT